MEKQNILKYLQDKYYEAEKAKEESERKGFSKEIKNEDGTIFIAPYYITCEMSVIQPIIDNMDREYDLYHSIWQGMSSDLIYTIISSEEVMKLINFINSNYCKIQ